MTGYGSPKLAAVSEPRQALPSPPAPQGRWPAGAAALPWPAGCASYSLLRRRRENGKAACEFSPRHPSTQSPVFRRHQSKCNNKTPSPIPIRDVSIICSSRYRCHHVLFTNFFTSEQRYYPIFLKPISLAFSQTTTREVC